ncbi:MAG: hypothetical protein WAX79_00755, partial [Candidatus Omnitrophota bacterium]
MCKFISFFHSPINGDVVVSDLESHGNTETALKLNNKIWREGHYLSNGEFELRLTADDRVDVIEYNAAFKNRFPTFLSFLNWALDKICVDGKYSDSLDLNGLTSAKDLVLPKTIGGSLGLNGLTSAKDLVLPKTIGGSLYLNGLTSAKDLVLPKTIGGSLDLNGLTSAKDLV